MYASILRLWGIAFSALLIVGAVMLSQAPLPQSAQAQGLFELAQAQPQAEPVAFIVRFRGGGPIARAQARAGRGQVAAAQRDVEAQLTRQRDFAGLCFDRFTVGGAEMVLRTCNAVPASERSAVQQRWVTRLRAMRAVEYVDPNAVASPGRSG